MSFYCGNMMALNLKTNTVNSLVCQEAFLKWQQCRRSIKLRMGVENVLFVSRIIIRIRRIDVFFAENVF